MTANRLAISSEALLTQARRRSMPGSMRPNAAGVNMAINDSASATLPLSSSEKPKRSISSGPSHRPRSDRNAA
ncbi:hypothetical protein D3C71_1859120 [compost metagenome]